MPRSVRITQPGLAPPAVRRWRVSLSLPPIRRKAKTVAVSEAELLQLVGEVKRPHQPDPTERAMLARQRWF